MSSTHTAVAMWMLTTSDGRRLADIRSEMDARRIVHTLGITQLRGPYSWDVVDNQGRLFVAEIRHRSGVVPDDCRAQSAQPGYWRYRAATGRQ
jgi:hypothetical protein